MAIALLIATGLVVCVATQVLVQRYWLAVFLSIVATMIAWVIVGLVFAFATKQPLFDGGQWPRALAVLGAAAIAQVVAIFLRRFRYWTRLDG